MENPLGTAVDLLRAPLGRNLIGLLAAGLFCCAAQAGPNQVYGSELAWVNNLNNSTINSSFRTNSAPSMTVWYDFSSCSLYGYPAQSTR